MNANDLMKMIFGAMAGGLEAKDADPDTFEIDAAGIDKETAMIAFMFAQRGLQANHESFFAFFKSAGIEPVANEDMMKTWLKHTIQKNILHFSPQQIEKILIENLEKEGEVFTTAMLLTGQYFSAEEIAMYTEKFDTGELKLAETVTTVTPSSVEVDDEDFDDDETEEEVVLSEKCKTCPKRDGCPAIAIMNLSE